MNTFLAQWRARLTFTVSEKHLALVVRALPIAGAMVFVLFWADQTLVTLTYLPRALIMVGWAAVLGIAGFFPWTSVVGSLVVLVGEWGMSLYLANTAHAGLAYTVGLSSTWTMWWAVPIALAYVAATNGSWRLRWAALVAGGVGAVGYAGLLVHEGYPRWNIHLDWHGEITYHSYMEHPLAGLAVLVPAFLAFVAIAWLIGVGLSALLRVRAVTTRLETTTAQLDEADLELRLAHDRGRISRDIHDSLAHSLAIIVAQAEGAAAIHELKPEAAPESLANIATVARSALTEVRSLVERINDDEDVSEHTSRLEHIPGLIAELRSTGVDATLRVLGETGPLALSKQVAVFRIVQESLTNALKHGGRGSTVTVTLDAQGAGLAVLVVSKSGGGEPLVNGGGRGIGIAGMKERARLVGGWLTAVPSDDETFVVTAFIPPDAAGAAPDEAPQAEASDHLIDADSETGALAIEGARG
jgi:signal transduction histidine kinase